jgi:hypothetical protein
MACLGTAIQMARCDFAAHLLWVWLLVAVSAPLMTGARKVWTSASMIVFLLAVLLLTRFVDRLPGQIWIKKITTFAENISPNAHPQNKQLGFWLELLLRCFTNIYTSAASVLVGEKFSWGVALGIPYISYWIAWIIAVRLDGEWGPVAVLAGWCIIITWCSIFYVWVNGGDPETLVLLVTAMLAHLAATHKHKDSRKIH